MDKVSKQARSKNMSKIRSKDTKPEMYFRLLLYHLGLRYRKNYKGLAGKPDLYISKYKTAIFINGCFWHRHTGCKFAYHPKSNIEFWETKFKSNVERDRRVYNALLDQGVKVIIVWECTVLDMRKDDNLRAKVLNDVIEIMCQFQINIMEL